MRAPPTRASTAAQTGEATVAEKKRARPLLVATVGLGVLTLGGGCFTSGNLMVARCDPPLVQNDDGTCSEAADAGVPDAGVVGGDR